MQSASLWHMSPQCRPHVVSPLVFSASDHPGHSSWYTRLSHERQKPDEPTGEQMSSGPKVQLALSVHESTEVQGMSHRSAAAVRRAASHALHSYWYWVGSQLMHCDQPFVSITQVSSTGSVQSASVEQ